MKPVFAILFILLVFLLTCVSAQPSNERPLIWNMSRLETVKGNPSAYPIFETIILQADNALSEEHVCVTSKDKTFAPSVHYYCGIGRYWWPDLKNPDGPYIRRDGYSNPEIKDYDSPRLNKLLERLRLFAVAYFFTGDIRYRDAYVGQIKVWFINRETLMYPSFEYAQVNPGHNGNKGVGAGLVAVETIVDLLDSYRLVKGIGVIDTFVDLHFRQWVSKLLCWMKNSSICREERRLDGNIPVICDLAIADMDVFLGKRSDLETVGRSFASLRICRQIGRDGRQLAELSRADAFSYSIYNLKHIVDFCLLQQSCGIDFYSENRELIDAAFIYLLKYVDEPDEFPYSQVSSWEKCTVDLMVQMDRLSKLGSNIAMPDGFSSGYVEASFCNDIKALIE